MKTQQELENQLAESEKKSAELREQIEEKKQKNKTKNICDEISDYSDILKKLDADESKDIIVVDKFDESDINWLKEIIRKVRICKVYNGRLPKRGDRRWHNWYDISSGFVFYGTGYDVTGACTASSSRLCFLEKEHNNDFVKKFPDVDEAIIDVK